MHLKHARSFCGDCSGGRGIGWVETEGGERVSFAEQPLGKEFVSHAAIEEGLVFLGFSRNSRLRGAAEAFEEGHRRVRKTASAIQIGPLC